MRYLRRSTNWATSTTGVLLVMTAVMIALTVTTVVDDRFSRLPARWWLIVISGMAAGSGLWAMKAGPTQTIRFWCGGLWAAYAAIRSASWLEAGSFSGALVWLPTLLLGLTVFARRRAAPHVGGTHDRST